MMSPAVTRMKVKAARLTAAAGPATPTTSISTTVKVTDAMILELRIVALVLMETSIYVTTIKPAATPSAATRICVRIATKRPILVKAGASREIVNNATGVATAYQDVTHIIAKCAMARETV
jgi:hypothetical protein